MPFNSVVSLPYFFALLIIILNGNNIKIPATPANKGNQPEIKRANPRYNDTDKYAEMLDDDDVDRINSAYDGMITHLLDGSGLTSTYENYAYNVSLQ